MEDDRYDEDYSWFEDWTTRTEVAVSAFLRGVLIAAIWYGVLIVVIIGILLFLFWLPL